MPLSCAAEVAPTYGAAMLAYQHRRSGDVELLQEVIEQDPGFAVGRATAALWAVFMAAPFDAHAEVSRGPGRAGGARRGSGRSWPRWPRPSRTDGGPRCRGGSRTTTSTPAT